VSLKMSCDLIASAAPVWLNPAGLCLDFVGVILLGKDLVRVQRSMKWQAREDLTRFAAMVEEHGGMEEWIKFIRDAGARWIDEDDWGYHADDEDELSIQVTNTKVRLGEALKVVAGISDATAKLIRFQHEQAQSNNVVANASIRFSLLGLLSICIGFALQLLAALHQLCGTLGVPP
jgi:hypothetical protein